MAWERTIRKRLYPDFSAYLSGKKPDWRTDDAAWKKLEGLNADAAGAVKMAVNIPVICAGSFQSLAGIQKVLEDKKCDAVSIGRPLLANPDLAAELVAASKSGKSEMTSEHPPCTLCNRCLLAAPEFPLGCLDDSRLRDEFPDDLEARYQAMIERVFSLYKVPPNLQ